MQRRHESTSYRTTAIVLGFAIASIILFIGLSRWLAPERVEPPPISVITFEAPPSADAPNFNFEASRRSSIRRASRPDIPEAEEEPEEEPFHDDSYATITGVIVDIDTREPLSRIQVSALWNRSDEEKEDFRILKQELREQEIELFDRQELFDREAEALELDAQELEDLEELEAIIDKYNLEDSLNIHDIIFASNLEHSNTHETTSDGEGRFTIHVPYDRLHSLRFRGTEHKRLVLTDQYHDSGTSPPEMLIEMSLGAEVSGRVYDLANNNGIPFAPLYIHASGKDDGSFNSDYAYTDEDGEYFFTGLDLGPYEIRVNYRETRYKPGKVLPYKKLTITQEREKRNNVDFGLARAGVVWGYTRNPQTNENVSAELMLVNSDNIITQGINAAFNEMRDDGERNITGRSDDREGGYYELVGVPLNKEWRVHALSSDTAPQLSGAFVLTETSPDIRVDMNLFAGTSVFGKVIDEDGYPVPKADVMCIPGFADFFSPLSSAKTFRNATTQEDGTFELDDLPAGTYQIFASKEGYKLTIRGVPVNSDGYNNIHGILVRLHNIELGEYDIYGKVTDSRGRAIPGAEVNLDGFSMQAMFSDDGSISNEAITDENGEYRFVGMALGTYFMKVESEGYAPTMVTKVWLDKPTNVVLGMGAVIQGTVYSAETNRPFGESFQITAQPDMGMVGPITQNPMQFMEAIANQVSKSFDETANGEFQILVQPGTYSIQAQAGSESSDKVVVIVDEGDVLQGVQLFLGGAGGTIDGWVTSSTNENIQGTRVRLASADIELLPGVDIGSGQSETQTVGEDGAFIFENVPSGTYVVNAVHPAYAAAQSEPIMLEGNTRQTVTLTLTSGGNIEGQVLNRGRPVPNATVMLINTVDPKTATSDASGYFVMEEVSAGEHTIIGFSALSISINIANMTQSMGDSVVVENGITTRITLELYENTELIEELEN
ncbi:MAG: DUF2012 domain-containing protein [Candidatus Hydrogenedentota bacterium]